MLKVLETEIFCKEMQERIIGYYNQYLIGVDDSLKEYLKGLKSKLKGNETALEGVLEAITKVRSEALFGKLARLEEEKAELINKIADTEMKMTAKKVSDSDIKAGFEYAQQLVRSGKLSNMSLLIETFVDRVTLNPDGIYVELNFSKFRHTPPPNPYRDLSLRDQLKIAREMYEAEHGIVPGSALISDEKQKFEENSVFTSNRCVITNR